MRVSGWFFNFEQHCVLWFGSGEGCGAHQIGIFLAPEVYLCIFAATWPVVYSPSFCCISVYFRMLELFWGPGTAIYVFLGCYHISRILHFWILENSSAEVTIWSLKVMNMSCDCVHCERSQYNAKVSEWGLSCKFFKLCMHHIRNPEVWSGLVQNRHLCAWDRGCGKVKRSYPLRMANCERSQWHLCMHVFWVGYPLFFCAIV